LEKVILLEAGTGSARTRCDRTNQVKENQKQKELINDQLPR